MQHWNRLPRYYALKDSTLHEQSIWASLRTISFDFFLSHPASLLLILTSCVNTRKEDRELPSYTNKSTYFIRFVHILSFFFLLFILSYASSSSCIENLVIQSNPQAPNTTASLGMSPVASLRSYPCPTLLAKTIREIQMTSPHDTKENVHDNCI